MMYPFFATCMAKYKDPSQWMEKRLEALANPEYPIAILIFQLTI